MWVRVLPPPPIVTRPRSVTHVPHDDGHEPNEAWRCARRQRTWGALIMRSESQRDPAWKDWHTILYGKEACRQTEKWSFTGRPTKEQALEPAGAYLRRVVTGSAPRVIKKGSRRGGQGPTAPAAITYITHVNFLQPIRRWFALYSSGHCIDVCATRSKSVSLRLLVQ
jgi:hypothetical protein